MKIPRTAPAFKGPVLAPPVYVTDGLSFGSAVVHRDWQQS